jgi:hypothetical protein
VIITEAMKNGAGITPLGISRLASHAVSTERKAMPQRTAAESSERPGETEFDIVFPDTTARAACGDPINPERYNQLSCQRR